MIKKTLYFLLVFVGFITAITISSCQKEDFDLNSKIAFTRDTLRFDTVFVQRGSATRKFKILNKSAKPIVVSEIKLAGGAASPYKINIDGIPTTLARDIEIAANDSLYVFVQVNIDPTNDNSPFIVTDSITTLTNGVRQKMILEAFGQNAIYVGSRANGSRITQNETWSSTTKPYVIYGWLVIDSTATLTIAPGVHIYLHGGIVNKNGIFSDPRAYPYFDGLVYCNGNLKVMGTHAQPVFIQGDRLEHDKEQTLEALNYEYANGQWQGIIFAGGTNCVNSEFNYCMLKNGVAGFYATSGSDIKLRNTMIINMSQSAFIADNAKITASNCLFSGSSGVTANIIYGGNYEFNFCTLASYSRYTLPREKKRVLSIFDSKCFEENSSGYCIDKRNAPLTARFNSCIITGQLADEVKLDKQGSAYDLEFKYCMIKRTEEGLLEAKFDTPLTTRFNLESGGKPLFKEIKKYNLHLDSLSVANGIGDPNKVSAFPLDLDDKPRKAAPAAGCYETTY